MGRTALALLVGTKLSAEPPGEPVEIEPAGILEWQAPPGCPHPWDVGLRLTELLGAGAPANARDGRLRAVGVVDQRDESGEYVLKLQIYANGAADERTLAGPRCDELALAFALVVALALDPIATAGTVHGRTRNEVPEPPRPMPWPEERESRGTEDVLDQGRFGTPAEPTLAGAPERGRTPLAVAPYGRAALAYGPARATTAAVGGGVGLSLDRVFSVELGARHRFGAVVGTDVSTRITATTAIATGCAAPRTKLLEFPICLGLELGAIRATDTRGLAVTRAVRSPWSAVALGARLMWPVKPWLALGAHASGFVSYSPVVFGVDDDDRTVFVSLPVGALAGLAIEGRISVTKFRGPG